MSKRRRNEENVSEILVKKEEQVEEQTINSTEEKQEQESVVEEKAIVVKAASVCSYNKKDIENALKRYGSSCKNDCGFAEGRYGITQDLDEYSSFIIEMQNNSFEKSLNIGMGDPGEFKFFRDFINVKESVVFAPTEKIREDWKIIFEDTKTKYTVELYDEKLLYDNKDAYRNLELNRFKDLYAQSFDYIFVDLDLRPDYANTYYELIKSTIKNESFVVIHDTSIMAGPLYLRNRILEDPEFLKIWFTNSKFGIDVFFYDVERDEENI